MTIENAVAQLCIAFAGSLPVLITAIAAWIRAAAAEKAGLTAAQKIASKTDALQQQLAANTSLTYQAHEQARTAAVNATAIAQQINGGLHQVVKEGCADALKEAGGGPPAGPARAGG